MLRFDVVLARALACAPLFLPAVAHAQGTAELAPGAARYNISASPGAQEFTTLPYGSAANTTTSLALKGVSIQSNLRNFLAAKSMQCVTDAGRTPGPATGCVADFADMKMSPGGLDGWGRNASILIDPGFIAAGGKAAHGDEINVNNYDVDIGNFDGDPYGIYPGSNGLNITAIGNASPVQQKVTGGIGLSTQGQRNFNRGFYASIASITQCTFCDYGSGADKVVDIRGPHQLGIDLSQLRDGNSIRVSKTGNLNARKADDSGDVQVFGMDGADTLHIGALTAGITLDVTAKTLNVVSATDEGAALGASGLRYNSVWAGLWYPHAYTFAALPTGQPAGTMTYCSNCRKPGEGAGAGTGMPVVFSNGSWSVMNIATPQT
jgi:hypothetical protein